VNPHTARRRHTVGFLLRRGREVEAFNRNQVSLGTYPDQAATRRHDRRVAMIAREPKVQYVVTLEGAAGADIAHAHTLRFVLKRLLRARSLRGIEVRQVDYREPEGQGFRRGVRR